MSSVQVALSTFWNSYGIYIKGFILWTFLVIAFMHAVSYFITYVITLANIAWYGEANSKNSRSIQFTASIFLVVYVLYNIVIYGIFLRMLNFRNFFWNNPFQTLTGVEATFMGILRFEPFTLVVTTWFKILSAMDAMRRAPSNQKIQKMLDKQAKATDASALPYVTIVMPIYNEPIETLMIAINSVTMSKYPLEKLHLVMAFDADAVSTLYRSVIYCLTSGNPNPDYKKLSTAEGLDELGVSSKASEYPFIGDVSYRGLHVTPCRFVHGGKRHAQMCAYRYLADKYSKMQGKKPLLLFIDSDIELERYAVPHFVADLNSPGVYREALTGLITCKTAGTYSFWKVLQDTEYIESQMLQRNGEDYLGSVSCLPGALTMVRFETLDRVAPIYFSEMKASGTIEFNRTHLGEDRYLTHLIMESRKEKYRIGFCGAAKCKTEGCETFQSLMKQRRRWYLGTVVNEIFQLTSPIIWKQFTALNVLVALSALKNGPLFIYAFMVEMMYGNGSIYSWLYIGLIFAPIWAFMILVAVNIKRLKIAFFYPILLVVLPIMAASFQIYGMMTFKVQTWGGPRAAAAVAKPAADIEEAHEEVKPVVPVVRAEEVPPKKMEAVEPDSKKLQAKSIKKDEPSLNSMQRKVIEVRVVPPQPKPVGEGQV